MAGYAVYRLPKEEKCTFMMQAESVPLHLESCQELDGHSGFVIAPFVVSDDKPIVLLQPETTNTYGSVGEIPADVAELIDKMSVLDDASADEEASGAEREHYSHDFKNCHDRLVSGVFRKIVLARMSAETVSCEKSPFALFRKACETYPRMFVALFSTPLSGTWLMATPEVLLEQEGDAWHTIALAGTMQLEGDALLFDVPLGNGCGSLSPDNCPAWSDKNIQEQRYVATYIKECNRAVSPMMCRRRDLARLVPVTLFICAVISVSLLRRVPALADCSTCCILRLPYADCLRMRRLTLSSGMSTLRADITVVLPDRWMFADIPNSMSRCAACTSGTDAISICMPEEDCCKTVWRNRNGTRQRRKWRL